MWLARVLIQAANQTKRREFELPILQNTFKLEWRLNLKSHQLHMILHRPCIVWSRWHVEAELLQLLCHGNQQAQKTLGGEVT